MNFAGAQQLLGLPLLQALNNCWVDATCAPYAVYLVQLGETLGITDTPAKLLPPILRDNVWSIRYIQCLFVRRLCQPLSACLYAAF